MGKYRKYGTRKKKSRKKDSKNSVIETVISEEKKIDILLATFWRYGYFLCTLGIIAVFGNKDNFMIILGVGMIIYAIYTWIIASIPTRHFLLGMLDAEHRPMKLAGSGYTRFLDKWQAEGKFISLFFAILNIVLIIV